MKSLVFMSLFLSTAAMAQTSLAPSQGNGGSTPFVISGDKIATLFQSQELWRYIHGQVESLETKSATMKKTVYSLTTVEVLPVLDANGAVVDYTKSPCIVSAEVGDVSEDEMVPEWKVVRVDFSLCPAVKTK